MIRHFNPERMGWNPVSFSKKIEHDEQDNNNVGFSSLAVNYRKLIQSKAHLVQMMLQRCHTYLTFFGEIVAHLRCR